MAERYDLFRLSLLPRQQRDAFEGPDPTREEYLRKVFGERRRFMHYGVEFHYVPSQRKGLAGDAILGRVGRSVKSEENQSPDEEFVDIVRDAWKAVVIVVDPREHADGQKVAIEHDPKVGSTISLVGSLVASINEAYPRTAYNIEVAPIIDAESFWEFAEANRGQITTLTFEFVAPNMFGGSDSITEELRSFRNVEHAQKVNITLASKEGLETDTLRTREAVDYAVKGGGKIRARTRGGRTYNSTKKVKTTTLPSDNLDDEPALVRAARLVTRIFGRE